MEPSTNDITAPIESSREVYIKKSVNWIYITVLFGPLVIFVSVILILSSVTEIEFIGDWQIWTFIFMVPGLGFVGGVFLKREELWKSLIFSCIFLLCIMAFVTSGLAGRAEILNESSVKKILLSFLGGIIYGGAFGLVDCVFVVLTTYVSYYFKSFSKNQKFKQSNKP